MSNSKLTKLAAGLVLAGTASIANAATISYDHEFSFDSTSVSTDSSISQTDTVNLSLTSFDSSLGALQGVVITFGSNWELDGYVSASDSTPIGGGEEGDANYAGAQGSIGSNLTVTLNSPANDSDSIPLSLGLECFTFETGAVSCNGDANGNTGTFSGSLYNSLDDAQGVDLSAFLGNINADVERELIASIRECAGTGGDTTCSAVNEDNSWIGELTITYIYDEANVPEPATLAMFGLGLIGLGFARRKA